LAQEQPEQPGEPKQPERPGEVEQPPTQDRRDCTCTIEATFDKGKATHNGLVRFEIPFSGEVKSNGKGEIKPTVTIDGYLVTRIAGGAWKKTCLLPQLSVDVLGANLTCGEDKKFRKNLSWGDVKIEAKPGDIVEAEAHLFATCADCKMKPVRYYAKFTYTRPKPKKEKDKEKEEKPTPVTVEIMTYTATTDAAKRKVILSPVSRFGWLDADTPAATP
jgi:hypothetical protein